MKSIFFLALVVLFMSAGYAGDTLSTVTVYWPSWCARCQDADGFGLPPWNIDYTGITHIVHFHNGTFSNTSPYWRPAVVAQDSIELQWGVDGACGQFEFNYQDSLIKISHRHGVKVLITMQAVDPSEGFNFVASDSDRTEVFATSVTEYVKRKGYDGVELNLEDWIAPPTSDANINRFIRIVRRKLNQPQINGGRGLFFTSAGRDDQNRYFAETDSAIDMHNLQCYSFSALYGGSVNKTWYLTPISRPPSWPAGLEAEALDYDYAAGVSVPQAWVNAGHSRKKIGIGLGLYGVAFWGTDTPAQTFTGDPHNDIAIQELEDAVHYGGVYEFYNNGPRSPSIHGTAANNPPYDWMPGNGTSFYITYEDSTSLKKKIDWMRDTAGVGGLMLYDFSKDVRTGESIQWKHTPYISAAARYTGASTPANAVYRSLEQGWNIVSVPVTTEDRRKTALFPESVSNAFAYVAPAYISRDTLDSGVGYWLKFRTSQGISIAGGVITTDTIDVVQGWNLIGSVSSPVPVGSIVQIPGGIVTSQYFGFTNGTYLASPTITPLQGYWVKVNQDGKLVLTGSLARSGNRMNVR